MPRLPDKPKFADLEALRKGVADAPGGALMVLGWELRLAAGESRLKEKARVRVEEALRGAGLVPIPGVPEDQKEEVLLTRAGSAAELLWLAYQRPTPKGLKLVLEATGEAADATEREDAIAELRELLGEAQEIADRLPD